MSNFMGAVVQELPIGYIFEFDPTGIAGAPDLSTPEKVHNYFGYGTWERYGVDRVTVGAGGKYVVGSEGGEETHLITAEEIPSLEMGIYVNGNTSYPIGCWEVSDGTYEIRAAEVSWTAKKCQQDIKARRENYKQSGTNIMQPYVANYRYRRIA